MTVFRAFIAIELPEEIQEQLDKVCELLKTSLPQAPIRWVPARNVHLTLKFLGDVSEANYAVLAEIVAVEARNHGSFVISVGGLGAFPDIRRPRVVWVGVEAPDELHALQRGIEAETLHLGYAAESRTYSPHLTIGRLSRNAHSQQVRAISQYLHNEEVGFLGVARIESLQIFRSDLRPGGAVYTRLYSAPLGGE
jgi:2'-5' RNA ligase